jgi:hypothetical protein
MHHKVVQTTDSPHVYKLAKKSVVAKKNGRCEICPLHGGENAGIYRHPRKNWKFKTKSPKQYKPVVK